jgi:hypothetical protein
LAVWCGCQTPEPPLSPAAAAFKKEVQECLANLTRNLAEPVSRKDVGAIRAVLKNTEAHTVKLCRLCPFTMGVLNRGGNTLALYPFTPGVAGDYSNYEVVQQVLKTRKPAQQRLYLQDGDQIYVVCAPIFQEENLVGLVALSLHAEEARARWGITEPEFLAIDFSS